MLLDFFFLTSEFVCFCFVGLIVLKATDKTGSYERFWNSFSFLFKMYDVNPHLNSIVKALVFMQS